MNVMLMIYTIFFGVSVLAADTALIYGAYVFWTDYKCKWASFFFYVVAVLLMVMYVSTVFRVWG